VDRRCRDLAPSRTGDGDQIRFGLAVVTFRIPPLGGSTESVLQDPIRADRAESYSSDRLNPPPKLQVVPTVKSLARCAKQSGGNAETL